MAENLRPQCKIQSINYMYQIIKEEFAQLLKDRVCSLILLFVLFFSIFGWISFFLVSFLKTGNSLCKLINKQIMERLTFKENFKSQLIWLERKPSCLTSPLPSSFATFILAERVRN